MDEGQSGDAYRECRLSVETNDRRKIPLASQMFTYPSLSSSIHTNPFTKITRARDMQTLQHQSRITSDSPDLPLCATAGVKELLRAGGPFLDRRSPGNWGRNDERLGGVSVKCRVSSIVWHSL